MAILEIRKYPDPVLKEISEPVEKIDDRVRSLVRDMFDTMYNAPGIGLAAPQIGVLKRIIILDVDSGSDQKGNPIVLINPEVVSTEGEITFEEGCLSVPDFSGDVERYEKVTVEGLSEDGDEVKIKADGLLAVALQHEIDHLNGILFIDRLGSVKRDIFRRKFRKIHKKRVSAL